MLQYHICLPVVAIIAVQTAGPPLHQVSRQGLLSHTDTSSRSTASMMIIDVSTTVGLSEACDYTSGRVSDAALCRYCSTVGC